MKAIHIAFALTLATVMSGPASAEPWIVGLGGSSCGEWLKARSDAKSGDPVDQVPVNYYASWIQGFLVGLSLDGKEHHSIDQESMNAWMDNHCRAHPLDDILHSAIDLDVDLLRHARGLPEKG